jgi:hypothetical protein
MKHALHHRVALVLLVWLLSAEPALALAEPAERIYSLDVSGWLSQGELGNAQNVIGTLSIGAGQAVTGIGWDVSLRADAPSWLSEMGIRFFGAGGVFVDLFPATETREPGTGSFASSGIVDLGPLGLSFQVGADGLLRFELFESFDDLANAADGAWQSGTVTVRVSEVPEPLSFALFGLGLFGIGVSLRNRSASAMR